MLPRTFESELLKRLSDSSHVDETYHDFGGRRQ